MKFDLPTIRELADLLNEKDLAEIKLTDGEQSIKLKSARGQAAVIAAPATSSNNANATPPSVSVTSTNETEAPPMPTASASRPASYHTVTSPMVGTYYQSPSPESPAFITVGQRVNAGQTVCIIEAMKLMNELESDVSGSVVELCVENGAPVEFGQAIVVIDTAK
ncbi:MAG: acetyl-CoA carboxylase biotin carboxyl carrier protein [Rickettsiales bacterium]